MYLRNSRCRRSARGVWASSHCRRGVGGMRSFARRRGLSHLSSTPDISSALTSSPSPPQARTAIWAPHATALAFRACSSIVIRVGVASGIEMNRLAPGVGQTHSIPCDGYSAVLGVSPISAIAVRICLSVPIRTNWTARAARGGTETPGRVPDSSKRNDPRETAASSNSGNSAPSVSSGPMRWWTVTMAWTSSAWVRPRFTTRSVETNGWGASPATKIASFPTNSSGSSCSTSLGRRSHRWIGGPNRATMTAEHVPSAPTHVAVSPVSVCTQ
jgi:hypothetical protein